MTGSGVKGTVEGKSVLIGSAEFLNEQSIVVKDSLMAMQTGIENKGRG